MKKYIGLLTSLSLSLPIVGCNVQNSSHVNKIINNESTQLTKHTNITYFVDNKPVKKIEVKTNSAIDFETIQKPGYKFAGYFFW